MSESWLILETSGRVARLGLARDGVVVRRVDLTDTRRHARDLAATIEAMLNAESLRPAALTGVMASRGPGSYTGLRVGLMSAKALAYATGCRLVAVETFAAIAEQAPPEAEKLWVIADALQGQIYRQRFDRSAGGWGAADELRIDRVEDWLNWATPDTWITGPGVSVYADRLPADCRVVPDADRDPRVESVFAVGGKLAVLSRAELFALEPLYLRPSSAEEKRERK